MDAKSRRSEILKNLQNSDHAIVARNLADQYNVSRQVIVGDIAILRASGEEILSTPKGYLSNNHLGSSIKKKIVCIHTIEQTKDEIEIIVGLGGKLLDVSIEHPLYGEISGTLNIFDAEDADDFLNRLKNNEVSLLLELTRGLHTHTISADSLETIHIIEQKLQEEGFIYNK